jgi:hypothetical protein
MNCFVHDRTPSVGLCAACQRAVCRECVGRDAPRVICRACTDRGGTIGFEWKTRTQFGGWPLVHIAMGVDAITMRPRIAKGVIAIGNIAVGAVAIAGVSLGLVSFGGLAVGLLAAFGGAALGAGVSFGGLAVGSIAVGGGAIGLRYAVGGSAFGPAVIDGRHCDAAARALIARWVGPGALPPSCL